MVRLAFTPRPWLRRLDHLICMVPDIDEAMDRFQRLGFPEAWPVGPFWPNALTSGVALGGFNLEFIQPLQTEDAVTDAHIRTLVFEPIDLPLAQERYSQMAFPMELREKWEADPELLRRRGFTQTDTPQLICRNLVPMEPGIIDFFLCDYAPFLKARLAPERFDVPPAVRIHLAGPVSAVPWMNTRFPLPSEHAGPEIVFSETTDGPVEVVEIETGWGPHALNGWPARFRLT